MLIQESHWEVGDYAEVRVWHRDCHISLIIAGCTESPRDMVRDFFSYSNHYNTLSGLVERAYVLVFYNNKILVEDHHNVIVSQLSVQKW